MCHPGRGRTRRVLLPGDGALQVAWHQRETRHLHLVWPTSVSNGAHFAREARSDLGAPTGPTWSWLAGSGHPGEEPWAMRRPMLWRSAKTEPAVRGIHDWATFPVISRAPSEEADQAVPPFYLTPRRPSRFTPASMFRSPGLPGWRACRLRMIWRPRGWTRTYRDTARASDASSRARAKFAAVRASNC